MSQLLDRNSASIAKTLLVQMSKCSFTEFRNELARVLDTRCKAITKASLKPVSTKAIEVEEDEEQDAPPPSTKSSNKPNIHHKEGQEDLCAVCSNQGSSTEIRSGSG